MEGRAGVSDASGKSGFGAALATLKAMLPRFCGARDKARNAINNPEICSSLFEQLAKDIPRGLT